MKRRTIAILTLFVLALTPLLLAGCSGESEAAATADATSGKTAEATAADGEAADSGNDTEKNEEKKEEAVPVETAVVGRGAIEALLRSTTNIEAESAVAVFARTTGLVVRLAVEEGSPVRKGDLLLQIEDEEQRSAVRKAEVALSQQQRDFDRLQRLFGDDLISEQEFNEARFKLEQDQIALGDARRNLEYTAVRAPIPGTVSLRSVNLGERVQTGAKLFEIVDFDTLVARVYLPEKEMAQIAVGQPARLGSTSLRGREFKGRVNRISPVVDAESGTVKVTVAVGDQPGLRPGMYVDVALVTRTEGDAVLLPKRAVIYDRDRTFAYRVDDERRARKVAFEVDLADKTRVKPREGFSVGEKVIVAGQMGLKDGALVELIGAPEAQADAGQPEKPVQRAAR